MRSMGWCDMTDEEILTQMRDVLRPKGTMDAVRLGGKPMWFKTEFVNACINELSRLRIQAILGDEPTPLQKLAYEVLKDSAYISEKGHG
jgi:hypothetical protein